MRSRNENAAATRRGNLDGEESAKNNDSTANGEHCTWGQRCDGWHLVRSDALSVIQERMPPAAAEVRRGHAPPAVPELLVAWLSPRSEWLPFPRGL